MTQKGTELSRYLGRQGEEIGRAAVDIGAKTKIVVNGRVRFPDGLTSTVLSEVKNVKTLSFRAKLKADGDLEDYLKRKAAVDEDVRRREADYARLEAPIVAALRDVGFEVRSVWDLVNSTASYGLAVALSNIADDAVIEEVITLAKDSTQGESRVLFVPVIKRSRASRALTAWGELQADPVLHREMQASQGR